jgi:hypothetical protein
LKNSTNIPATGPKIKAAINAGISLKSINKKFGNGGSGKFISINRYAILLSIPIETIALTLIFFFILFLSPFDPSS